MWGAGPSVCFTLELICCPKFDGSPWLEVCHLRRGIGIQGFYTGVRCLLFICFACCCFSSSSCCFCSFYVLFQAAFFYLNLKQKKWVIDSTGVENSLRLSVLKGTGWEGCWIWFGQMCIFMFITTYENFF